jgi:K+-transporting ATPase c subunit
MKITKLFVIVAAATTTIMAAGLLVIVTTSNIAHAHRHTSAIGSSTIDQQNTQSSFCLSRTSNTGNAVASALAYPPF